MKYQRKPKTNDRQHFNAWQIATKGGKLARVSVARYRRAFRASFLLGWLNDYADKCAEYDNDATRYTEEGSNRRAQRLEQLESRTAEALAPLGFEFFNSCHFYDIAEKGTEKPIYTRR